MPLTLAGGVVAKFSVNSSPTSPAPSSSKSFRFSEWSGPAFGYPACPDLESRTKIVELLQPEKIGVTLSENFMLVPEQSTDALVVHHPQAKYFDV